MEEDINYLKYGIKELEGSYELHNREWAKSILQEMKNSLEHLIKAYKELEENNSLLIQQNITYKRNIHDLKNKNIPVSLVEEKIKELIKEGRHYNANKIEVLQELLEKR